jgi:hypothetical protein
MSLRRRHLARLLPLVMLAGCRVVAPSERIAADQGVIPPNTVMFSQMMRELSARPGFTEQLLAQLDKGEKSGALLTPRLFDLFRKMILGSDWSGLDRFPGWSIRQITRTVDVGAKLVKGSDEAKSYVDLGPYSLNFAGEEHLDEAPTLNCAGLCPYLRKKSDLEFKSAEVALGDDVIRGDGPDPKLAPLHAESVRLAQAMNRLALNGEKVPVFTATVGGQKAATPEQLLAALAATGHTVLVADVRYFANFGHFHYKGQDVEMPFWLDSGLLIPADHWWQRSRHLLVPVAHAEYEWIISGPKINADVTFYFGIDGRAEFRTNDEHNQPWVMGRRAHEYRGADALEVTRLSGKFVHAYADLHSAHAELPFGGYYTLGVCQDSIGAIEMRMTGKTTLFPNTAKTDLFHDQPDEEITRLMEAVPKDDQGDPPTPERIFGSLPTEDYGTITIPALRDDVQRTHDAWHDGTLHYARSWRRRIFSLLGIVAASGVVLWLLRRQDRNRQ